MERAYIDISTDLDGDAVVHACFDLTEAEISASAHAIRAGASERFERRACPPTKCSSCAS